MILLLLTLALAQEPEIVTDEELSQYDIEWIDKIDAELNDEVELPKIESINEVAFKEVEK